MRRLVTVPLIALAALGLSGAAIRSPKHATNQIVLPPAPTAPGVIKPPHPFHLNLAWATPPGFTAAVYCGTNSPLGFTGRIATTNSFLSVSNLWPNTPYQFAVSYVDSIGRESYFSPILYWPRPKTNSLGFGLSATVSGPWTTNSILTNPPDGFWRIQLHPPGYDFGFSRDLKKWDVITNWPASNALPNFYLHGKVWDNVTGYQHAD